MRDPYSDDEVDRARMWRLTRATPRDELEGHTMQDHVRVWVSLGWARLEDLDDAPEGHKIVRLTDDGREAADAMLS